MSPTLEVISLASEVPAIVLVAVITDLLVCLEYKVKGTM
jgi:hypothetical protein